MPVMERDLVVPPQSGALSTHAQSRDVVLGRIKEMQQDLARLRATVEAADLARLVGSDGTELELPADVYEILLWVLDRMANGEAFALAPVDKELTTQQAADLLNISRPFLIQLLNRGAMPYTKAGTHRRVRLIDALAYREERFKRSGQVLGEMGREEREWEDP